METEKSIFFYGHTNNEFDYMSNFYSSYFSDDNENVFTCSEQYFMFKKAILFEPDNTHFHHKILSEKSPTKIKAFGRQVKHFDEMIWSQYKFQFMLEGVRLKFNQNPEIATKLKATHNKVLYEAAKNDNIWGIGMNAATAINLEENHDDTSHFGQNLLGICLMTVRNELLENESC